MRKMGFVIAVLLAAGLGWTGRASAQAEHYGNRPWELNVNAGAHFFDNADDTDVGFGGRIFMNMPSGLGFGGNFTWVLSNTDFEGTDFDVNTYLYSGEIEYTFASPSRLHPFVGAGLGAATVKISDVPEGFDDSDTNLLIPLVGGVKFFNRTNDSTWAIRGEVRDNIIRFSDGDSETTHNWEVSGGISFLFGGG